MGFERLGLSWYMKRLPSRSEVELAEKILGFGASLKEVGELLGSGSEDSLTLPAGTWTAHGIALPVDTTIYVDEMDEMSPRWGGILAMISVEPRGAYQLHFIPFWDYLCLAKERGSNLDLEEVWKEREAFKQQGGGLCMDVISMSTPDRFFEHPLLYRLSYTMARFMKYESDNPVNYLNEINNATNKEEVFPESDYYRDGLYENYSDSVKYLGEGLKEELGLRLDIGWRERESDIAILYGLYAQYVARGFESNLQVAMDYTFSNLDLENSIKLAGYLNWKDYNLYFKEKIEEKYKILNTPINHSFKNLLASPWVEYIPQSLKDGLEGMIVKADIVKPSSIVVEAEQTLGSDWKRESVEANKEEQQSKGIKL